MAVIESRIQTVEDIYRIIRTAVVDKCPVQAVYAGRRRLLWPHRLGRNSRGELRVLCYQFGNIDDGLSRNETTGGWRCIVLEKLTSVGAVDGPWYTPTDYAPAGGCVVAVDVEV